MVHPARVGVRRPSRMSLYTRGRPHPSRRATSAMEHSPHDPRAAESTACDFHALFQKVATMEDEQRDALSQELSSVFHEYPFQFIKALTQEDYALHDPVRKMIAEYNTSAEGNAEYIQFLLSLIPQLRDNLVGNENNTFLALLTAFDPNVNNAGEEFIAILFTALRYADGRAADQCSTILFRIFQQDPKSLVKELTNERVKMGTGTLYTMLGRLVDDQMITVISEIDGKTAEMLKKLDRKTLEDILRKHKLSCFVIFVTNDTIYT